MTDVRESLAEHAATVADLTPLAPLIETAGEKMIDCLRIGGKILWMGNGGSAADSQHMAAEIVGRFQRERKGLPSIALTTDTSILTALANDFGYEQIFARQIEALGETGDVVVAISTSGNSPNILNGIEEARRRGLTVIGLTGAGGGRMADACDVLLAVPSNRTPRIQECHLLMEHILCDLIDAAFAG
jgi:D-sedoheptulose 7-phosphate isomerase